VGSKPGRDLHLATYSSARSNITFAPPEVSLSTMKAT
jgi:hypothetical protein